MGFGSGCKRMAPVVGSGFLAQLFSFLRVQIQITRTIAALSALTMAASTRFKAFISGIVITGAGTHEVVGFRF